VVPLDGSSVAVGEELAVAQGAEMVVRRSCCNGGGDCVEMVARRSCYA